MIEFFMQISQKFIIILLLMGFPKGFLMSNFSATIKTHYIHFVTKKDKSAKLMTCYNKEFVACTSSTKFLGMSLKETLSWDNHIEALAKKFSMTCYIIRSAKIYMSTSSKQTKQTNSVALSSRVNYTD
jgi:hypothetical protein